MSNHHLEKHRGSSERVRDFIIGMSDGLTVPFALAAGLSGAALSTKIIVTAGLAEIAAGSIAMALGGFLAAKTEREHYHAEYKREVEEIELFPEIETQEVDDVLKDFGVPKKTRPIVVESIKSDKKKWVEFMMRFELGLEKPKSGRQFWSPLIIGLAYIFGGLLPLIPYMLTTDLKVALNDSIVTTGIALILFGVAKGHLTGISKLKSAFQTCMIGGLAALTAYQTALLFS